MSAVGLIINGRSNRSPSVLTEVLGVARRFRDVNVEVLDGILGLDRALIGMNRRGVDTLILGGGDGTIQAAFTDAINNRRFERAPKFVALACGMTNVIAQDCGLAGAPAPSLERFLKRREAGEAVAARRALLTVAQGTRDPIHGFFLGAGAFHSAVQFSRAHVQSKGAKRSLALALSVAGYVAKFAFDAKVQKDAVRVAFAGGAPAPLADQPADLTVFLATTLSKLGAGIYPFWGEGPGAIVATAVASPARRFLAAAPAVVRGVKKDWFEAEGYRSWRADRIVSRFAAPFVFDGEIFEARSGEDLVFGTAHNAEFLR
ncbi:MAG: hypothetical protein HXY23_00330 [Parvularculaceae bacterium]|nr:hypothetical protein [Parvularculaceae bacterium]